MKRLSSIAILNSRRRAGGAVVATTSSSSSTSMRHQSSDASFVNGLFKRSFNSKGMFPFPAIRLSDNERSRLDNLLNEINSNGGDAAKKTEMMKNIAKVSVPLDRGGLDLTHTSRAAIMETLGEGKCLEEIYSSLHACTCAHLINTFAASGDLKGAYLPLIASGEARFAFAVTEENIEVDVSMCEATAVQEEGSGVYRISGTKALRGLNLSSASSSSSSSLSSSSTTPAQQITHFIVLAKVKSFATDANTGERVELAPRSTLFIVANDKASGAVTVDGGFATFKNAVALDVVGGVGEGFSAMMVSKHTVRNGFDAAVIGTCKGLYNALISTDVSASAAAAADKAAVLHYMAALIYGMESAVYCLTAVLDKKSEDALIDAAFTTIAANSCANRILTALDDYQASYAVNNSAAIDSFKRQLQQLLTVTEPVESLQAIAACCGVEDFGLDFQKEGTLTTMGGRMARALGSKQRLPLKVTWPEVAPIEDQFAAFGDAIEAVFVKLGPSLRYKQMSMERIAESGAFLYTACAAVSRATTQDKLATAASERAMCKVLLPILTADAGALIKEVNNSALAPDDGLVRVVGEMIYNYVNIDPSQSAELIAEDKKKAAEEAEKKRLEEEAAAAEKAKKEEEEKKKSE